MSIAERRVAATAALGRELVVALTSRGPQIPAYGNEATIDLSPAMLELLVACAAGGRVVDDDGLAAIAAAHGDEVGALASLIDQLTERGLLREGAAGPGGEPDGPIVDPAAFAAPEDTVELALRTPTLLRPVATGFALYADDGLVVAVLGVDELVVASAFAQPATTAQVVERLGVGADAVAEDEVRRVASLLGALGLLRPYDPADSPDGRLQREMRAVFTSVANFTRTLEADLAEHEAAQPPTPPGALARTRVLPMLHQPGLAPLALGMLFAYARSYRDGALLETYDLVPNWNVVPKDIERYADAPGLYLFSNYVWSVGSHLVTSAAVKAANPANLTVHGGPDTPRRVADVEQFFRANPHVDVAVHGEGEITTAEMLAALAEGRRDDGSFDLSVLADVPGLSFRLGDEVVRTDDRERQADLDELPSPYLTGEFDSYRDGNATTVILETNRGCPYGCTFCDWGSATLSRIRKFDLDRVLAELDWCARNKVSRVFVADANFGIFERDVEIARHLAKLKAEYGYPRAFGTNYAKNTVKHLRPIVQAMVEADVVTEGLLSLQTMDEGTLSTIKRSNIKTEKYDLLASEFREAGLPLYVDLMLGLPGSTTASFRSDLQQCIDREVTAKIFQTEVLVNSPMNEPSYREEHQISTAQAGDRLYDTRTDQNSSSRRRLVVSTASFTRDDYDEMLDLRRAFRLFENYGVLRHVTRYARYETGTREVDVIEALRVASKDPVRWPYLCIALDVVPDTMVPPLSWRPFLEEVGRFLVDELGVADDPALQTVLTVQRLLVPAPDRRFPLQVELPHDYVAWHRSLIAAKESGWLTDWPEQVAPLRSFGPGQLAVDDPARVCTTGMGFRSEDDFYGNWELESPISRAMPARHQILD